MFGTLASATYPDEYDSDELDGGDFAFEGEDGELVVVEPIDEDMQLITPKIDAKASDLHFFNIISATPLLPKFQRAHPR